MNKYLIYITTGALLTAPCCAQDPNVQFVADMQQLQKTLLAISSYHSSGKIDLAWTDEFARTMGVTQKNYHIHLNYDTLSKAGDIKVDLVQLDTNGNQVDHDIHYLNPNSYSRLEADGDSIVSSDVVGSDEANMNDFFGPFLAFSFLIQPSSIFGFRPVTPAVMSDVKSWNSLLDLSKSKIQLGEKGSDLLSYQVGENRWEIQLQDAKPNGLKLPKDIKFYTTFHGKQVFSRHLIINKYFDNPSLKFCPQSMTLQCYALRRDETQYLVATFLYTIEKVELNPKIEDETLEFDPSTASRIWDADKKVFIDVPH